MVIFPICNTIPLPVDEGWRAHVSPPIGAQRGIHSFLLFFLWSTRHWDGFAKPTNLNYGIPYMPMSETGLGSLPY